MSNMHFRYRKIEIDRSPTVVVELEIGGLVQKFLRYKVNGSYGYSLHSIR